MCLSCDISGVPCEGAHSEHICYVSAQCPDYFSVCCGGSGLQLDRHALQPVVYPFGCAHAVPQCMASSRRWSCSE
ncbi:unnamed protein product [Mycena citricolor]|uniref:Uncharacterized protein n=1 Tax=Mycena citricolor TaxID=2018698 RepID=A0AAD2HIG7_9AGAR|nr:unnamed protein product [Mycena citricolor]